MSSPLNKDIIISSISLRIQILLFPFFLLAYITAFHASILTCLLKFIIIKMCVLYKNVLLFYVRYYNGCDLFLTFMTVRTIRTVCDLSNRHFGQSRDMAK